MRIPNRFKGLSYVNVHSLRLSFLAGCLFNLFLFAVVLAIGGAFFLFTSSGSAGPAVIISTVPPLPVALVTVPPAPTLLPPPTLPAAPTYTPAPTLTPAPSPTLIPTLAPLPTSTPFTLTVVLAVPTPTPTKLYNLGEILGGAPVPAVSSEFKYGFYRGVCLDGGPARIEPRVVGLPQIVSGLHWRLWNDYGWSLDTSSYEESYSEDTALFLSSDPALFHLALFYFDQQISDRVEIDYPGACGAIQIIYVKASRAAAPSPENVWIPGGQPGQMVLTTTGGGLQVSLFQSDNNKEIAEIFDTMGKIFYEFGLVSDKFSWLAGRYQMPVSPRKGALLVSGWLKVPIKTDLLPTAVHLEDLQDERLLSALKSALGRNVETRSAPVAPLPGLLWESKATDRYPAAFDFWFFIELNVSRLHGISRLYEFSMLPHPSKLQFKTLPIPLGFSISDKFEFFDLAYLTGTLVCGATNTGKSVLLRQIINYLSIYLPGRVRFILGDFKEGVEFGQYASSPLVQLCASPRELVMTVETIYRDRYDNVIKPNNFYSLVDYNASLPPEKHLPYYLVIVDEFSEFVLMGDRDLMKQTQKLVSRTRGAGVYWIICTQRPSIDIVPGSLKANLGSRISFSLASTVDAEVVFDLPDFTDCVRIGCPGRGWALVGDKIIEFQSSFAQ